MNDLALLQQHDPAAGALPTESRHELLASIRSEAPARRTRRMALVAALSAAAAAGSGGIAYAVLSGQDPQTALKVNCAAGVSGAEFAKDHEFTSVIDVQSGDPVGDCAAEYARLGIPVPALRAYSSGSVFIWVVPSSWSVPPQWQPLDSAFRSDTSRLTLKRRVEDPVDGPAAGCRSTDAARRGVTEVLTALHADGWSITAPPGASPADASADGSTSCAFVHVDEEGKKVIYLQAQPPVPAGEQPDYDRLLARLRTDVAQKCLPMGAAKTATQRALADTGVAAEVTAAPRAGDRCTAIDLVTGGLLRITLS